MYEYTTPIKRDRHQWALANKLPAQSSWIVWVPSESPHSRTIQPPTVARHVLIPTLVGVVPSLTTLQTTTVSLSSGLSTQYAGRRTLKHVTSSRFLRGGPPAPSPKLGAPFVTAYRSEPKSAYLPYPGGGGPRSRAGASGVSYASSGGISGLGLMPSKGRE